MPLVKEAIGSDSDICFDVHTHLDTAHAITLCKALEAYRPFFIEDPLRSENPSSYRNLARHVSLPIAAGEQWTSKWAFREVIEEELINYARIDLCIVGGLTEALKVTHWCETHYIDIAPHNPLGPVSATACVVLCMASTNVGVQEMPRKPGNFAKSLFPQQIRWSDDTPTRPMWLVWAWTSKKCVFRLLVGPRYSDVTTTGSPTGSRHTYAVSLGIFSVLALDVDIDGRSSSGRTVL
jgi:L-alanine-DL-glutamate epimerase-like enolase superfamily enzyme